MQEIHLYIHLYFSCLVFHNSLPKMKWLKAKIWRACLHGSALGVTGWITRPNSAVSWAELEDPRNLHWKNPCLTAPSGNGSLSPRQTEASSHRMCQLDPSCGAGFQDGGSQRYQPSPGLGSKPRNSLSLNFIAQSESQRQCDSTLPPHMRWHVCRKREVSTAATFGDCVPGSF